MGEAANQTEATLAQIQSSLDLLHGCVANIDTNQQQLRTQVDHQAAAIADSSIKHDDTARVLAALVAKLETMGRGAADKPPHEEAEPDPRDTNAAGKGVCHP